MLQYAQIEEILGKRPASLFPVHIEDESLDESDGNSSISTDQLTEKEQAELEDAVARLRVERNIPGT